VGDLRSTRAFSNQVSRSLRRFLEARPHLSIAIVIVVFGILGLVVSSSLNRAPPVTNFGDGYPPEAISTAVLEVLAGDRCHPAAEAEAAIRSHLEALRLEAWAVVRGPGIRDTGCVTLSVEPLDKRIVVLMAVDPVISRGIAALAKDLLQECRTKEEAIALMRAVLAPEAGPWELRTDGGLAGPNEMTVEEVRRHVEAGCWIYSGTGWTADGTRIYALGGK